MNIEPIEIKDQIITKIAKKIQIYVAQVILKKSVTLMVHLMDNNNQVIENKTIILANEDYTGWANDDDYITLKVLEKLNYTIAIA